MSVILKVHPKALLNTVTSLSFIFLHEAPQAAQEALQLAAAASIYADK